MTDLEAFLASASVDQAVVEEIVEAAAVDFAREGARVDAESRLRGELIEELVAGEVISRDTIIRRARLLGADLSNGAVGLIGTLKAQDPAIVVDDRVGRRFLKAARAVIDHDDVALAGKCPVSDQLCPDRQGRASMVRTRSSATRSCRASMACGLAA